MLVNTPARNCSRSCRDGEETVDEKSDPTNRHGGQPARGKKRQRAAVVAVRARCSARSSRAAASASASTASAVALSRRAAGESA